MKNYYGIIYKVTNRINGKVYIGQTTKPLSIRKSGHLSKARNRVDNTYFHSAIRKHGEDNFIWKKIVVAMSQTELDELEKSMIVKYDSMNSGYNIIEGGNRPPILYGTDNPRYGVKLTSDIRKRIGDSERGEKGFWFGKKMTKAHREKVSKALLGKKKHKTLGEKLRKHFGDWWLIEFPSGEFKVVQSLRDFCMNHNLCESHLRDVNKGVRHHHKGYKCKKLNEDVIQVRRFVC